MAKVVHKLDRDDWSEYPDEGETLRCDLDDILEDPKCSTDWQFVTCKRCLKIGGIDRMPKQ